jgi:hypothetical protein
MAKELPVETRSGSARSSLSREENGMNSAPFQLVFRRAFAFAATSMLVVVACDDPVSVIDDEDQIPAYREGAAPFLGEYALSQIAGAPPPYRFTASVACTRLIREGTLTLRDDSSKLVFELVAPGAIECPGAGPTIDITLALSGTWTVDGESIRFSRIRPDGQLETITARADGASIAVRGLVTAPASAEEAYRRP